MLESIFISVLLMIGTIISLIVIASVLLVITFMLAMLYVVLRGIPLNEIHWKDWRGE